MPLTKTQFAHYLNEGFVAVEGLIPTHAFTTLIAEIEANIDAKARALATEGKLDDLCEGLPFEKRLTRLCAGVTDE
ncbi:uncharacterized protein METZ01_LOCUS368435, partial [marine metagenome]